MFVGLFGNVFAGNISAKAAVLLDSRGEGKSLGTHCDERVFFFFLEV